MDQLTTMRIDFLYTEISKENYAETEGAVPLLDNHLVPAVRHAPVKVSDFTGAGKVVLVEFPAIGAFGCL